MGEPTDPWDRLTRLLEEALALPDTPAPSPTRDPESGRFQSTDPRPALRRNFREALDETRGAVKLGWDSANIARGVSRRRAQARLRLAALVAFAAGAGAAVVAFLVGGAV